MVSKIKRRTFNIYHLYLSFRHMYLGLGVVPGERSFFHENKQNDQERSHRSKKKNEHIEGVLKNIGTICKGTEQKLLKKNV